MLPVSLSHHGGGRRADGRSVALVARSPTRSACRQTGRQRSSLSTFSNTLSKLSVLTSSISSWTPTSTLTATEVIDRVRAARDDEHAAAVVSVQLAVQWALLHPCARTPTPPAGAGPPSTTTASSRWPDPAPRWSTEFAPASLGAALGITPGRREAADRRRPGADLPTPPPLGPRGRRAGPGLAGPHDQPGDPRPVRRSRRLRRPTHLRDPRQGPPGQRHPARRRSQVVLRPRPRRRGRTPPTRQARRLGPPRWRTRHHRRVHDPGHPRRRALRPDHQPHRRRARCPRRHRRPRHPPRKGGRDPRRPPVRPRPALRPRRRRTHQRSWGDEPLPPPHPARPRPTHRRGGSIEKLGAATTDLLADWLARHAPPAEDHRPTGPRPQLNALRSTSTTHPTRCANRSSCATATASSPAADATPGPATSTTSPPTSRWTKADHPARPTRAISRHCAGPTTGSRPTPPGTTNASTRRHLRMDAPTGTSTKSTRSPGVRHHEESDAPPPRPTQAGAIGTPKQRQAVHGTASSNPRPPQPEADVDHPYR